jgi:uncharacterized protein YprB with RNaseH-like and TPR domain
MLGDRRLEARLSALLARRARGDARPADSPLAPERVVVLTGNGLPGAEIATPLGPLHVHERRWTAVDPGHGQVLALLAAAAGRLEEVPATGLAPDFLTLKRHGLDGALILDLETGGLAGHPVFLAGLLILERGELVLRQFLARSYLEEPALIAEVGRMLAAHSMVVTYNGKSFDLPMLADRAVRHGLPWAKPAVHVDLLHHARRAYRDRSPDCRLVTLERGILRRWRSQGLVSRDIPGVFHRFARDGDPTAMVHVLHHNAHDVISLAELLAHLIPHPPGRRFVPDLELALDEAAIFDRD